jgi:integrase
MPDPVETTYYVRIWKTEIYAGKRGNTYNVVWWVDKNRFKKGYRQAAAAESFRSELVTSHRKGEAFDIATGLPVSKLRRETPKTTWYEFACAYVDMKWPHISGKYRKGVAEALVTVTPIMLTEPINADEAKAFRSALQNWGFNTRQRNTAEQPDDVTKRLTWISEHSRPVTDLARPDLIRAALDAVASRLDGGRAAGRTTHRKRAVLFNAANYAVELGLLAANPIEAIKWSAPKSSAVIDRRSVVNPQQARALLATVAITPRTGKRLTAFFGCIYYAALRPEEAVDIRKHNLDLPKSGWGWITIEQAAPDTGKTWSDSGEQRDSRQLKHRAPGDTRRVPSPPELTQLLHQHLQAHGTDDKGRLFRGTRGGELATVTYVRIWDRARASALTKEQYASPLASRPYDLRHAAVSTWLNGGVAPTQVAEWAGHSVDVLLKIYAKCLDGQEDIALKRIGAALGRPPKTRTPKKVVPSPERPPPPRRTTRSPHVRR